MGELDTETSKELKISNGSSVAVIGSGPAGCFFSYFLFRIVDRLGVNISLDIYERQNFTKLGPAGCNHCGGIVSESLIQLLATEGINLPTNVVQRGIDSYVLHTDEGSVRIDTPLHEKRIAALHRGAGPLGAKDVRWRSFDGYLQELSKNNGANIINENVVSLTKSDHKYIVETKKGGKKEYDLVVGAVGVNSTGLKLFKELDFEYEPPGTTKTYISEFHLGVAEVTKRFGGSMHVFLLNLPRLAFAALIPKGDYVTLALIGKDVDKELIESFLGNPKVKGCFPADLDIDQAHPCQCRPDMNIKGADGYYEDRLVLIGDCAVTKLYKNGIGAAYYTAKAAATTVALHGISKKDFDKHYKPECESIRFDNGLGHIIFLVTSLIQKFSFFKRGILRVTAKEQKKEGSKRLMSMVLWDTFTGSAPYKEILMRTLRPSFIFALARDIIIGFFRRKLPPPETALVSHIDGLGQIYEDREVIINQGDEGDCLYVIQFGAVEVIQEKNGKSVIVAELGEGDFFGEMALFEKEIRSGTVRAKGSVRILTVDKFTFYRRIEEDPSLAFRMLELMSSRLRATGHQLSRIQASDRRNWRARPEKIEKN